MKTKMDSLGTKTGNNLSRMTVNEFEELLVLIKRNHYLDEHLNYIKDVINKRQLHTDDVLKTMGFEREQPPVGLLKLKDALKKLDLTLTDMKALRVAQSLLGPTDSITMSDLTRAFDCQEEGTSK